MKSTKPVPSALDRHSRAQAARWGELVLRSGPVLIVRVIGAGLGFAFHVALARVLGAAGLGIYHVALTLTLIASVVGRMGMAAAIVKVRTTSCVAKDCKPQVGAPFMHSAALPTTAAHLTSASSANARGKRCRPTLQREIEELQNLRSV